MPGMDRVDVPIGGPMEKLLLRPHEVAQLLDVGRSKVYALIAEGEIPSVRLGGSVRVPTQKLLEWLSRKPTASSERSVGVADLGTTRSRPSAL